MDWQPIETSPRDGTRFLCWYEEFGTEVEIGRWGTGSIAGRFYIDRDDDNVHQYPRWWMPLPSAPIEAGAALTSTD